MWDDRKSPRRPPLSQIEADYHVRPFALTHQTARKASTASSSSTNGQPSQGPRLSISHRHHDEPHIHHVDGNEGRLGHLAIKVSSSFQPVCAAVGRGVGPLVCLKRNSVAITGLKRGRGLV